MSGTKDTTDDTDLSLDEDIVQTKQIKEILSLRHAYIERRNEVQSAVRTGELTGADGAELLKGKVPTRSDVT
jgi:hypothetical protein